MEPLSPHGKGAQPQAKCPVQKATTLGFLSVRISAPTHLIKGPYRVYFGLDLALIVQANQLGYNSSDELVFFVHVAEVVAAHCLVLV